MDPIVAVAVGVVVGVLVEKFASVYDKVVEFVKSKLKK